MKVKKTLRNVLSFIYHTPTMWIVIVLLGISVPLSVWHSIYVVGPRRERAEFELGREHTILTSAIKDTNPMIIIKDAENLRFHSVVITLNRTEFLSKIIETDMVFYKHEIDCSSFSCDITLTYYTLQEGIVYEYVNNFEVV